MSVLKVKNGNQWDIVPAIKGDTGDPAADESITDDMLVTDGIKTEIEWLWGNQLMDSREGEILHAEDAYTAPAVDISVDGKSTQVTTTGKNLLNPDDTTYGFVNSNGVIAGTTGTRFKLTGYIELPEDDADYYLNWFGHTNNASLAMCWYDDMQGHISGVPDANSGVKHAPSGAKYVRISMNSGNENYVMFSLGSVALTYEPYTGGNPAPSPDYPQEIESVDEPALTLAGKNLLDFNFVDQYTLESGGSRFTANGDGTFTVEAIADSGGSKTVGLIKGTGFRHINVNYPIGLPSTVANGAFQLPAGTYTFKSYSSNDATKVYLRIRHGAYSATTDGSNNVTFTTDGTEWCLLFIYVQLFSTLLANGPVTLRAQLEVGSTATAYKPYVGTTVSLPVTLRSLPDGTKDTLALSYLRPSTREGWAWYSRELAKRITQKILDGSENWNMGSSRYDGNLGTDSFVNLTDSLNLGIYAPNSVLSPVLKSKNDYIWANPDVHLWSICRNGIQVHIVFDNETVGISSSEEEGRTDKIKTWLSENPVTIYYPLATPTTETLDPIELPIMPSQTVNVWSDPATNLKMTYIQDSNLIIENLEATIADIATS